MDSLNDSQNNPSSSIHPTSLSLIPTDLMVVIASKKIRFTRPIHRQAWAIPESIVYYMAKNPSSAKVCEKLASSCKYFFDTNPIFVLSDLTYCDGEETWKTSAGNLPLGMADLTSKLWVTGLLTVMTDSSDKKNLLTSIIPKIYLCELDNLYLRNQTITYNDFLILASCAVIINLVNVTVKHGDGTVVALEELVAVASKARYFRFASYECSNITAKTFEQLLKIPHFLRANSYCFEGIPEGFDLEAFYAFMKTNNCTRMELQFASSISKAYQTRINGILTEILDAKVRDYRIPFITHYGVSREDDRKLQRLCR